MAKVTHGKRLVEDEEPEKHIAAEGKRILKDMVTQQLDTSLTIDAQQKRERTFVHGAPVDNEPAPAGAVSAWCFSTLQEKNEVRSKLLQAGVDLQDVDKLFSKKERGKLSEPEDLARQQLWNEAAQKLLDASNCVEQLPSTKTRLEQELRECVPATGIYAHLLQTQKEQLPSTSSKPADDLLTRELKKTEKDLFCRLHSSTTPSATGRKRRRDRKVIDSIASASSHINTVSQPSKSTGSLWDVKTVPPQELRSSVCFPASVSKPFPEPKSSVKKAKMIGCTKERLFTIKDGAIVELKGKRVMEDQSEVISSPPDTRSSRMTVDEIKALPKFSNYQPGTPHKVLFVKNFPPRLTEPELLAAFSDYSPLECRIMTGKMRGQAFVSFSDEETAERALDGVIGTIVDNKPLIVQFGRSQPANKTAT